MTLIVAFIFLLAYYYFILRKYNTLGFRLFSLCFFVTVAMLYWWWGDWRELKEVERQGISTQAVVQEKRKDGVNNILEVAFRDQAGNMVQRSEQGGISDAEFAELEPGDTALIRYSPASATFFLEKSFQRQNHDLAWFLLFPAFFLLAGCTAWFFLRRFRIHPHEGTVYEYMTDEAGNVVLDDAKNETTKNLKKANLLAKLAQLLTRQ